MLEIGYLALDSPIAVVSSRHKPNTELIRSSGLTILDGYNLDELSISDLESSINEVETTSALGFSVTCSKDEPLIEAARFAGRNLQLLEINLTDSQDANRALELVTRIKRCGTTLSLRMKPGALSEESVKKLGDAGLDIIHLDLTGLNGTGPKVIKRAADSHGPKIMALDSVGDFDKAQSLFSMGADLVSLNGSTDPEFASWLSQAMKDYERLSGWYNAPKHICSGGDLRGLSFCCPPVKHCPVLGALKKAGMTPDQFVEKKLDLAKGTPLQYGDGTCFGSLVWCCKITKPCFMRDAALRKIGLSGSEYMKLKRKLAEKMFP